MTKKLGEKLVDAGLITLQQLDFALSRQRRCGGLLGSNLVLLYILTEDQLLAFISDSTGIRSVDLKTLPIPKRVLEMISKGTVEKYNIIPISFAPPNTLEVACADPTNLAALDELSFITGYQIVPLLSTYSEILEATTRYYSGISFFEKEDARSIEKTEKSHEIPTGHKRIGELLLDAGLINNEQLDRALSRQSQRGNILGRNLIETRAISEQNLKVFLARQMGVEEIDLSRVFVTLELLKRISLEVAEKYHVVPVQLEGDVLSIACLDPTDLYSLDQLQFFTGKKIKPLLASYASINQFIDQYYRAVPLVEDNPDESTPIQPSHPVLETYDTIEHRKGHESDEDPNLLLFDD